MTDSKKELPETDEKDRLLQRSRLGQAIMLGTNVAVGFVVFLLIGYFIDKRFQTGSLWTIAGVVLGFLFAGFEFWKTIRDLQDEEHPSRGADHHDEGGEKKT